MGWEFALARKPVPMFRAQVRFHYALAPFDVVKEAPGHAQARLLKYLFSRRTNLLKRLAALYSDLSQ